MFFLEESKAPGLAGFLGFLHKCWKAIKGDLMEALRNSMKMERSVIALMPPSFLLSQSEWI